MTNQHVNYLDPDHSIFDMAARGALVAQLVKPVLQTRRGKRDNLEIIFQISPLKHMLRPVIRTVLPRQF